MHNVMNVNRKSFNTIPFRSNDHDFNTFVLHRMSIYREHAYTDAASSCFRRAHEKLWIGFQQFLFESSNSKIENRPIEKWIELVI